MKVFLTPLPLGFLLVPLILLHLIHEIQSIRPKGHTSAHRSGHQNSYKGGNKHSKGIRKGRSLPDTESHQLVTEGVPFSDTVPTLQIENEAGASSISLDGKLASKIFNDLIRIPVQKIKAFLGLETEKSDSSTTAKAIESRKDPTVKTDNKSKFSGKEMDEKMSKMVSGTTTSLPLDINTTTTTTTTTPPKNLSIDQANDDDRKSDPPLSILSITSIDEQEVIIKPVVDVQPLENSSLELQTLTLTVKNETDEIEILDDSTDERSSKISPTILPSTTPNTTHATTTMSSGNARGEVRPVEQKHENIPEKLDVLLGSPVLSVTKNYSMPPPHTDKTNFTDRPPLKMVLNLNSSDDKVQLKPTQATSTSTSTSTPLPVIINVVKSSQHQQLHMPSMTKIEETKEWQKIHESKSQTDLTGRENKIKPGDSFHYDSGNTESPTTESDGVVPPTTTLPTPTSTSDFDDLTSTQSTRHHHHHQRHHHHIVLVQSNIKSIRDALPTDYSNERN